MQIRDLIPWSRDRKDAAGQQQEGSNPLLTLQRDINRVFEDFWSRFDRSEAVSNGSLSASEPRTDLSEADDVVEVSIELPGMDEKDIEVDVSDDVLTIRGEKKSEREEKRKGYYLAERTFGGFYRRIPLPPGVDSEKAAAQFRKGVLTVTLPKTPEAQEKVRRIPVEAA